MPTKNKIVVVVSKKNYRRAVDRNKIKRRIRAIGRKFIQGQSKVVIIYAKKGMLELPFKDLEEKIKKLIPNS